MKPFVRVLLAAIVIVAVHSPMKSQEMVVSEYLNMVEPSLEWTELLVVADNLNAVGFIVTDNNTGQLTRQGGPQFRDIPLWRNLRAGTIIVLWHRAFPAGYTPDEDPADGYLEMSARDNRFFTTYYFAPGVDNDMNINQTGELVEVMKGDLTHVHALGFNKPTGPSYNALPMPKANLDSANISNSRSVRVSGRSIGSYGIGITKDSVVVGFNDSRGLPNRFDLARTALGVPNINHWFWRETREPKWTAAPTIALVAQSANTNTIEWTALEDPNPGDSTTGYLILRDTLGFAGFPVGAVRDGSTITKGSKIGNATVIDIRPTKLGRRMTDSSNILCGMSYSYRVYGYRYRRDDLLSVTDDTTARGRQYTDQRWAESAIITKSNPTKPLIQASRLQICPGDTVTLTTTTTNAVLYDWTVNGQSVPVGGTTRIVVRATGEYRLVIKGADGCSAISDPIVITALPAPSVEITPTGSQTICPGDSVKITVTTSAATYEWLRDGAVIPGATSSTYMAKLEGDYQVRIATSAGCPGVSATLRLRFQNVKVKLSPSSVDFGTIGQCRADTTVDVEIINEGLADVTITNASFPSGFALVSPAPGFAIKAGKRQTVRLVFAPSGPGTATGAASFLAQPCNTPIPFTVRGQRTAVSVALNKPGVDFGTYAACPTGNIRPDSTFCVTNSGTEAIVIGVPRVDPPFYLLTDIPKPVTIEPGTRFCISVMYRPLGADLDRGVIQTIGFPYTSASCQDTLRARVQGASYRPQLTVDEPAVDLGVVLKCSPRVDTVISVTNPSLVPVTVTSIVGSDISYSGGAVTIAPKTTKLLPVTITPSVASGTFSLNAKVVLQPCNDSLDVQFDGQMLNATYSQDRTEIDFGTLLLCERQTATSSFLISARGLSGLRSRLASIGAKAPFSVSVVSGQSFRDSLRVDVTFTPPSAGTFADTISYTIEPCSVVQKVVLRGVSGSPSRSTSISTSDFGTLTSGESIVRTITIANTSSVEVRVEDLDGVTTPFRIIARRPALPATLAPKQKAEIDIEYSFVDYSRRDTIRVSSRTSGNCADTVSLTLTGATVGKGTVTGLRIVAPQDASAFAGSPVTLPFDLTSGTPLDSLDLRSMVVELNYNPLLMRPESASTSLQGATVTVKENVPGQATVTIASTSPIIAMRSLFSILARTYVSDVSATVLDVDTAMAPGTIITGQDGTLTVEKECDISAGLVSLGRPIIFRVVPDGNEMLHVEFTTVTNDPVNILVGSVTGARLSVQVIATTSTDLHRMDVPIHELASGAYFVRFQHGRHVRTVPLTITR
ncbi:MAG: choice-of-anchor D domain-containing protein [Candidatus Kapabacteria bacterium]|nr:choice-of-anchor D domain-containing protein [Candidatus Kapabacteria bacterium]